MPVKDNKDDLEIDIDKDGIIERDEKDAWKSRLATHRKIALMATAALIFSGIWIITQTDPDKIKSMTGILDMYWITLGGIIATYMGTEVWATKK